MTVDKGARDDLLQAGGDGGDRLPVAHRADSFARLLKYSSSVWARGGWTRAGGAAACGARISRRPIVTCTAGASARCAVDAAACAFRREGSAISSRVEDGSNVARGTTSTEGITGRKVDLVSTIPGIVAGRGAGIADAPADATMTGAAGLGAAAAIATRDTSIGSDCGATADVEERFCRRNECRLSARIETGGDDGVGETSGWVIRGAVGADGL